jgi:DNA repair exonuclease SbcCD nuclease subunit
MKICVISDLHLGLRNANPHFSLMMDNFFTDTFFPYLKEHKIDTIIQLGDLFDARRSINFNALSDAKRYFFQPIEDAKMDLYTLIGNHDIFYRYSLELNAQSLLLNEYSNVHIYDKPTSLEIGGVTFDMIPWICSDNSAEVIEFIKNSNSDICCGHFEIENFAMYKGVQAHGGLSKNIFKRYKSVWSGHFHTRSSSGNIHYLGTPYQNVWNDFSDQKGFHIFDTETRELEFIPSPQEMFIRHEYNDEINDYLTFDISPFVHKYIKIVVIKKNDFYLYDQFLRSLYEADTYEIKILEDLTAFSETTSDNIQIDVENTLEILESYVESISEHDNKESVKLFMKSLYIEAIGVQN